MKITEKINFRQPKYMLPAILYFPLLGASYFIFDLFNAEKAEVTDKSMQTTEYLNPELPGAKTKGDGIGGKYENMTKAWGKIGDYTAVDNIERDTPEENQEQYESKYTENDIALLDEQEKNKAQAEAADAKTREKEAMAELEKALAEARLRGQTSAGGGNTEHGERVANSELHRAVRRRRAQGPKHPTEQVVDRRDCEDDSVRAMLCKRRRPVDVKRRCVVEHTCDEMVSRLWSDTRRCVDTARDADNAVTRVDCRQRRQRAFHRQV